MSVLERIAETKDLISLPQVASKAIVLLEQPDVHVAELSKLIQNDAAISLKMLSLANSPVYGLRNPVTSVHQAISTIGLNRVMNIVLGVSIFSKFHFLSDMEHKNFVQSFWEHSATTASIAKAIGVRLKKTFGDNEFIGGLIHDIGKLSLIQYDSSQYSHVLDLMKNSGKSDTEAEKEVFGVSHTEVGAIVSEVWNLPRSLQSIISHHDSPELAGDDCAVTSLVRLADIVCEKSGHGIGEDVNAISIEEDGSWRNLSNLFPDVKAQNINLLCEDLDEDLGKATLFLSSVLSN